MPFNSSSYPLMLFNIQHLFRSHILLILFDKLYEIHIYKI